MLALGGWISRIFLGTFAVLGSIRYGSGIYFWKVTEQLERPHYTVLQKLSDGVELRKYEPYIIAETTVNGSGFKEPTRDGFRSCAQYIFGKNKKRQRFGKSSLWEMFEFSAGDSEEMAMTAPVRLSGSPATTTAKSSANNIEGEKMAMTAPVRINGGENRNTKVSFVIGSQYTLQTAPKPIDKNVKLRQVPSHVLAVRTFSGPPPKDERVKKERIRVEKALSEVNLKPSHDETLVYGYHDPFITPNFLRRNEVGVVVEGNI